MRDAVPYSHGIKTRVDIYRNGSLAYQSVPVTGGSVSADRGSKARWSADVELALQPWEATNIDAKVCRFQVWRGLDVLGADQMIQLGEYRVDSVSRDTYSRVKLKGSGLESYVIDGRFLTPRTPPYGASTTGHITTLIREILPTATVVTRNTRNKPVEATAPWEKERWDAIDALAQSIQCEVYCDNTGTFVIADVPSVTGSPIYIFDEGAGGVLVGRGEEETRDRVYNAVVVSGSSTDPAAPPVWGWAFDNDPASPTYFYGAFGQVPRYYSSQFFTTDQQCTDYAQALLAESLAENKTLKFDALQLDFMEVGDLAGARDYSGAVQTHLLQTLSLDLAPGGALSATTLSAKSVITDGA